jgi:hypothetical protein
MPTLFVECRACHQEIPTPIAEPQVGPSGVMISSLGVHCPKCGHVGEYSTADFHVPPGVAVPTAEEQASVPEDLAAQHEAKLVGAQEKLAGLGVVQPEARSTHEDG